MKPLHHRDRVITSPCPICQIPFLHPESRVPQSCGDYACAREARRRAGEREPSLEELKEELWQK